MWRLGWDMSDVSLQYQAINCTGLKWLQKLVRRMRTTLGHAQRSQIRWWYPISTAPMSISLMHYSIYKLDLAVSQHWNLLLAATLSSAACQSLARRDIVVFFKGATLLNIPPDRLQHRLRTLNFHPWSESSEEIFISSISYSPWRWHL
jgi:hypothetical protein